MTQKTPQLFQINNYAWFLILALTLPLFIFGCSDQRQKVVTWTEWKPVYMSKQKFKKAVKLKAPQPLKKPGKIYLYKNYLFINEINKGIHIIDNSDPSNPSKIGFINIPSNKDIVVKDNLLYADSGNDLLVFDITNIQDPKLVARVADVFRNISNLPPGYPYEPVDSSKGIVVGWKPVKTRKVCKGDCGGVVPDWGVLMAGGIYYNTASNAAGGNIGIAGSTSRFAIKGNHLYAIDKYRLITFGISSKKPVKENINNVGWTIETIFPYKNSLFIGSQRATYIYDISSPALPTKLSKISHFTSCDPVVVQAGYAYVTLRKNGGCRQLQGVNRLEVYDVHNLQNPQRIAFYDMQNPHGLGIDDSTLFVSEGNKGLKVLNAVNPKKIKLLQNINDIHAKDLIPFNNVLVVTGKKGIYEYDYSDVKDLKLLSKIPVVKSDSSE